MTELRYPLTRRATLEVMAVGVAGVVLPRAGRAASAKPRAAIWDGHCHLSSVPGDTPRARMERLLEVATRMGVDRLVVFMGWPFAYEPSPDELRRQNDQVLAAIEPFPDRALGYAYLSPAHVDASLEEMDRLIARGPMVGVKLWVARRASDPALDPICRRAAELRVPIYQHTWLKVTGNLPGESTPSDLAALARRHPETTFFCGHAGGNWQLGIRAVRPYENVYLDIAGGDPTAGMVEMAVRELGAERVVYGSDAAGRSFASQLAKVESAKLPDDQKRAILGGNLRRILGM